MAGHAESLRKLSLHRNSTSFDLVDLPAIIAVKVMMMFLACDLVTGRLARDLDGNKPLFGDQQVDIPIDGGNTHRLYLGLGGPKRLFRRQRPVGLEESIANRFFLPGLSDLNRHS